MDCCEVVRLGELHSLAVRQLVSRCARFTLIIHGLLGDFSCQRVFTNIPRGLDGRNEKEAKSIYD